MMDRYTIGYEKYSEEMNVCYLIWKNLAILLNKR
jgi:hypothetical protein